MLSHSFNLAMDRSRGFGSITCYLFALFRLGFPTPTIQRILSLQRIITRWSIMQKVRRQPFIPEGMHRPSTACRFIISGSISLPSRGSFQLSLTVLVHFRSDRVFRLSPWSGQIPARFPVPGSTWDTSRLSWNFAYKTLTLYGVFFQTLLLSHNNTTLRSHNPSKQACWFSLFSLRSPLLRESHSFSSPQGT